MFRDDDQACIAIRILIGGTIGGNIDHLWSRTGPTQVTRDWMAKGTSPLSHGEFLMLKIAFAFWDPTEPPKKKSNPRAADFTEVITVIDNENMLRVAHLLVAYSMGASAIDSWIRKWRQLELIKG